MYEPYGYQEEDDYVSKKSILYNEVIKNRENDKKEFHDIDDLYNRHNTEAINSAYYDNDLESVIFKNVKGDAICSLKMTDIFPSTLIKSAEYDKDTQHLIITFDNDDTIDIDLNDLINNLEAGNGLILEDGKFAVLIAPDSEKFVEGTGEPFMTVDASGVKINHIQDAIDVEKARAISAETAEREARISQDNVLLGLINAETNRARGEESRIETTLNAKISGETSRAKSEESRIETKLDNEIADRNTHNNQHDSAIAALQASVTNLQATISAQQATISSLQTAYTNLERRVQALENRVYP